MTDLTTLLGAIERCYDAMPRLGGARVEANGPFEVFVRDRGPWPYYARPRLSVENLTIDDVLAVRARQRELGTPEAIEWVHDVTPSLLPAVRATGMTVLEAPLMVLDPSALPAPSGAARLLDPDDPAFAETYAQGLAVAHIAFSSAEGTSDTFTLGPADGGTAHRDALRLPVDPDVLAYVLEGLRAGHKAEAVVSTGDGVVARGAIQSALGAAEVVGVATLPAFGRRGHGAAISALLARTALDRGNGIVFLSAASADVARMYARIGFRQIGTAVIAGG